MANVPDVASKTAAGSVGPSHRPLHVHSHSIRTSAITQQFSTDRFFFLEDNLATFFLPVTVSHLTT